MVRRVSFLCSIIGLALAPGLAQDGQTNPLVVHEIRHDISAAVRSFPARRNPRPIRVEDDPVEFLVAAQTSVRSSDPVLQQSEGPALNANVSLSFDGLSSNGYQAPDSNGAVGPTQFVETTNAQYAVFDKTSGALLFGPAAIQSIWTGFGGLCESGGTPFDPIVLYDRTANRWFIAQLVEASDLTSFAECIAVSTSADATGSYARYAYSFNQLNDYPKFGIWPDAYYASYNMYSMPDHTFQGAQACAYDRAAMLAGQAAVAVCFQRKPGDWNLLPADLDGNAAPPAGSPNYYLELAKPLPSTSLKLYRFQVDFATPANSRFKGPFNITIAPWVRLCANTIVCIPQPSPGEKVDAIGYHLMNRLAYRNFGDHETLLATHTVDSGNKVAGIRWYEIRSPQNSPVVFQQGTYAKSAKHLWMGTMASDKNGNLAVGMNTSSTKVMPSVAITGRAPGDPPGTLQALKTVLTGTGVEINDLHRWGDYSSMVVDPADDCTFWYTSQYYKTTGNAWNTRVVAFRFPDCQ